MKEFKDRFTPPSASGDEDPEGFRPVQALLTAGRFLKRRFGILAVGLVLLATLVYLVISADGFFKSGELEREIQKLKAEIEALEDENRVLRQKEERSKTDPAYIEDEARKKLGLVRPGETVYRLSEEPDLSEDRPNEPPPLP